MSSVLAFFSSGTQKRAELAELHYRFIVACFGIVKRHIDNKDNLLAEIIKHYYLVEKHQVYIFKRFCIARVRFDGRLAVREVVIRKISYKSACK